MPQHLIIDNFTNANPTGAILFLYSDVGDDAFVKPKNFVKPADYEGQTVKLTDGSTRPMTEDDVYYNQYQMTKTLVFRNMDKLLICPNTKSHLFYTLDELAVVE